MAQRKRPPPRPYSKHKKSTKTATTKTIWVNWWAWWKPCSPAHSFAQLSEPMSMVKAMLTSSLIFKMSELVSMAFKVISPVHSFAKKSEPVRQVKAMLTSMLFFCRRQKKSVADENNFYIVEKKSEWTSEHGFHAHQFTHLQWAWQTRKQQQQ